MPSKKRKAAESDDSTPAASSSPVDLSKMSDKVRKKYLSDLVRQNKEIENAAKKKKLTRVKAAEKRAEADYQASSSKPAAKRQKVSALEEATPNPTRVPSSNATARKTTTPAGSGSDAVSDQDDNDHSSAGYDSTTGARFIYGIDPVLQDQSGTANVHTQPPPTKQQSHPKEKNTSSDGFNKIPEPKRTGKGAANVVVGTPQALVKTAVPRQLLKAAKQVVAVSSSSSSSGSSSDSDSSDDEPKPVRKIGPHTPYNRPNIGSGKGAPALTAMSPTSKAISEDARTVYSIFLATEDAFPKDKDGKRQARKSFLQQVDALTHTNGTLDSDDEEGDRRVRRGDRYAADPTYKEDMLNLTMNVDSSFRGHVVADAEPLVENEWNLTELSEEECREKVQQLLKDGRFTFADPLKRKGPFGCPVLPKLLRKSFLTKAVKKGHALGLGPNFHLFSEVPPALLAFLLTAVECVLRRYATGTYAKQSFTATTYEPLYSRHLKALHQTFRQKPEELEAARKRIWQTACRNVASGIEVSSIDDEEGYMRAEDFEEAEP